MRKSLSKILNKKPENFTATYLNSYSIRNSSSNKKWFVYRMTLPHEYIEKITELFKQKLNLTIEEFDVEQESQDFVYSFSGNNLIQHDKFKEYFIGTSEVNNTHSDKENFNEFEINSEENLPVSNKIDFIIHEFKSGDQQLFIFTKHKNKGITKSKLFNFNGDDFKVMDNSKIYVFDENISCAFINDEYYIFESKNFQSIFKYWEELYKIRDTVIEDLRKNSYITNFTEYEEDYKKFYNMSTLIKIKEFQNDIPTFLNENKRKLKEICDNNALNLTFNPKTCQFTIEKKEGVTVLNRILSNRSGHNLYQQFVTYPSFKTHKGTSKSS
ncbi:DUF4868 domain-containing protein [Bacillus spizizenii]|uniref:hypothetical protein n=1 Tax=Bacillus spizizenii TaxID=96241 RepID=UPI0009A373E5|nr:hypothetical protein [Bacillus spizizenii]OPG92832.1 hypothetical protein B2I22_07745 [Bacillus spizizenii]